MQPGSMTIEENAQEVRFCNIHLIAFHQESARQRSAALLILLDLFGGKAVDERLIFSFSKVTS